MPFAGTGPLIPGSDKAAVSYAWPVEARRLETALEMAASSNDLYPLRCGGHSLLFRVDGLTLKTTPTAHRILCAARRHIQGRSPALSPHDQSVLDDVIAEVERLRQRGLVSNAAEDSTERMLAVQAPNGIVLMIAQTCNMRCTYCYGDGGSYGSRPDLMSEQTACLAIDRMFGRAPGRRRFRVVFFGGEPLLNFRVLEAAVTHALAQARERKARVSFSITTNGTLLSAERARFLARHRFAAMISLDCSSRLHRRYRPLREGGDSYRTALAGIQRAIALGLQVQLRGTVVREAATPQAIQNSARTARRLGCTKLVLSPVDCSKMGANTFSIRAADAARLLEIYAARAWANWENIRSGRPGALFDPHARMVAAIRKGRSTTTASCGAFGGMIACSTTGVLYPCHRFVGMEGYSIGDTRVGVDLRRVEELLCRFKTEVQRTCGGCYVRHF